MGLEVSGVVNGPEAVSKEHRGPWILRRALDKEQEPWSSVPRVWMLSIAVWEPS